jgi:hypothetical protein
MFLLRLQYRLYIEWRHSIWTNNMEQFRNYWPYTQTVGSMIQWQPVRIASINPIWLYRRVGCSPQNSKSAILNMHCKLYLVVNTIIYKNLPMYISISLYLYLSTYSRNYIPTYLPTYLRLCLPIYLPTHLCYLPVYLPTLSHTDLPIYLFTCTVPNYPPNHLSIHLFPTIYLYTQPPIQLVFCPSLHLLCACVSTCKSISLHSIFLSDMNYLKYLLHSPIYVSLCSVWLLAPPSVHKSFQPAMLSLSSDTTPETAISPLNQFSSMFSTRDLCHAIEQSSFEPPRPVFFLLSHLHPHKPQDHPLFPVSTCLFSTTQITSRCRLHHTNSRNTTSLVCYETVSENN